MYETASYWSIKSTDTAAKKSRHFVTRNVKSDSKNQVKSQAGGAGIQVFRFKAIKPGTTTIRFIYGQSLQKPYPKDAPRRIIKVIIS